MSTFRWLTSGESHGPGLTVIVEGIPAGLPLDEGYIEQQLARRQRGYGSGGRMKIENDHAQVRSGVRHGLTLGSPVGMWIENKDFANWTEAMSVSPVAEGVDKKTHTHVVPGHADFAGALKYSQHDLRNVLERASARETTARVAAGAVARRFLDEFGVVLRSRVISIGKAEVPDPSSTDVDWDAAEASELRAAGAESDRLFKEQVDQAKAARTTVGGVFQVVAFNLPVGLGSHIQWDRKLDGRIAQAMLSINAVKGVEIGRAFANTRRPGREVQDGIVADVRDRRRFRRLSNEAGGIEGGMSNGEPVVVYVAVKPIATMTAPLPSVDINTGEAVDAAYHRSDICQVPRATPIGEAMLALVLAEAFLEKFGGDHIEETRRNYVAYVASHQDFATGVTAGTSHPAPQS